MFTKSYCFDRAMGCCSCFGLIKRKPRRAVMPVSGPILSDGSLLDEDMEDDDDDDDDDDCSYNGEATNIGDVQNGDDGETKIWVKRSEEILRFRTQTDVICRQCPVKETRELIRTEDENGIKVINEYVHECKIGSGSYGKVVLYRRRVDGKHYAIKAFHKSHLSKLRVGPSETALTDVLREVEIMKMMHHPNIVNLIEVIDDPNTDHFYMVLEYVEGKWVYDGSGPCGGLGEETARKYLRDIVSGLNYLHAHNIVHGDIKPDNLLITRSGTVKIGDFGVSQVFEDDNDELRRSPGTPVFTAPECCQGSGSPQADVTRYYMILGQYPFLGETLQDTYDKIVNNPLILPDDMNPQLKNLMEGLLCKDPEMRLTLEGVGEHRWVVGEDGPIPRFLCWCKRRSLRTDDNKKDVPER